MVKREEMKYHICYCGQRFDSYNGLRHHRSKRQEQCYVSRRGSGNQQTDVNRAQLSRLRKKVNALITRNRLSPKDRQERGERLAKKFRRWLNNPDNFDVQSFSETTRKDIVKIDVPIEVDKNEHEYYIPDDIMPIFENVLKYTYLERKFNIKYDYETCQKLWQIKDVPKLIVTRNNTRTQLRGIQGHIMVEEILIKWQEAIENQILVVRDYILKHGERMKKSEIPGHFDQWPQLGDLDGWYCEDADVLVLKRRQAVQGKKKANNKGNEENEGSEGNDLSE